MKTQIYALKNVEEAVASAQAGANFIGVTAGQKGRLAWELDFARCRAIFAAVRDASDACVVALTIAWSIEEIMETVAQTQPDVIHLSGEYDRYAPDMVGQLRTRVSPTKVMMAIPVGNHASVDKAQRYAGVADFLILDTDRPQVPGVGATGEVHDWQVSAAIVRQVNIPVILAGGLSPANVQAAIRTVRPWAVDSYSHTNADHTRYKDIRKVRAFIQAAQAAD